MTTPASMPSSWVPDLDFSARLALVRHRMGWNIKEAAIASRLPAQSWRGWELQGRLPRDILDVCRRITEATGVDFSWLLTGTPSDAGQDGPATVIAHVARASGNKARSAPDRTGRKVRHGDSRRRPERPESGPGPSRGPGRQQKRRLSIA